MPTQKPKQNPKKSHFQNGHFQKNLKFESGISEKISNSKCTFSEKSQIQNPNFSFPGKSQIQNRHFDSVQKSHFWNQVSNSAGKSHFQF